jgi:hypothetical protein
MEHNVSTERPRGLEIQSMETQNQSLLSKWLFKLINEDELWQTIIRKKYLTNQTIGMVLRKPWNSHFWARLIMVKLSLLRFGSFHLNNGKHIGFWEDKWLGNHSFQQKYPSLYNIARRKSDTVETILSRTPLNVSFCRYITGNNLVLWNDLVLQVMDVHLNNK